MTDAFGFVFTLVFLAIPLIVIAGVWKTFTKADEPGWAAIIPIYNLWIMVKISKNESWWILLFFIPLANILALFKISIDLAKQFGKGTGFGVGLALLSVIFFPLLGFGDAQYQGGRGGRGNTGSI